MLDGSETVEMDRVDRMKNVCKLTTDYITSVFQELDVISTKDGESVPEPECRCKKSTRGRHGVVGKSTNMTGSVRLLLQVPFAPQRSKP